MVQRQAVQDLGLPHGYPGIGGDAQAAFVDEREQGAAGAEGCGEPGQGDLLQLLLCGCGDQGGREVGDVFGALSLGSQCGLRLLLALLLLGVVADHSEDPFRAAVSQLDPTGLGGQLVPALVLGEVPQPHPGGLGGGRAQELPQGLPVVRVHCRDHSGKRCGIRKECGQGGCATEPLQLVLMG
ncbi:hypothetical protein [Streptomyces mirabilis]|uniref:hypothetical protein n=1 Tax=Streptomyces mirabilis TaxID=68239 RepID=UPI0036B3D6C5